MLVKKAESLDKNKYDDWSDRRLLYHNNALTNLDHGVIYIVAGLIISDKRTILLINNEKCRPKVGFYGSETCSIIENSLSKRWIYEALNQVNISYDDVEFGSVAYFGIRRILSEYDFYERYFDGSPQEVNFVEHEIELLLQEAGL